MYESTMCKDKIKKKHIDDVQPPTVAEHFNLLIKHEGILDSEKDVTPKDLPDWYDQELIDEAQRVYQRNLVSTSAAALSGLIAILVVPDILKVVIHTKQSHTNVLAFKRYSQTALNIYDLYRYDLKDPNSVFYKMVNAVRWKHKTANMMSQKDGIGAIYERDMVITQFGFVGFIFTKPELLGLRLKPEEEYAMNHIWRVFGYMLGIPDRLNLCRKTVAETRELCHMVNDLLVNYLNKPPPLYEEIVANAVNSLWYADITFDKDAFLAMMYSLIGMEYKTLGWYSWLNLKFRNFIFFLMFVPYIGVLVRNGYNVILMITFWSLEYFPLIALLKFGKEARLNLYQRHK